MHRESSLRGKFYGYIWIKRWWFQQYFVGFGTLAIETVVVKDCLQYWFYFQSICVCVWKWSIGLLLHNTNWSSWYYPFGGKGRLEHASSSCYWLFGMVHGKYNQHLQVYRPCASPSRSTESVLHYLLEQSQPVKEWALSYWF